MRTEPSTKRAVAFFDGQNLFYAVKYAFGYNYPNYDPQALAAEVCRTRGWHLAGIHFYTGIPRIEDDPAWNHFWTAKLAVMGTRGIRTITRHLKYRNQTVALPNGTTTTILVGQEKGIDVRIALDVVRMARQESYDIAVIFSQDQDLIEAADEVKSISAAENRRIQGRLRFPNQPYLLQYPRHQRHRVDTHRPSDL